MARCQPRELVTLSKQKRVRSDHQSANFLLDEICESRVDFSLGAGVQHINLYSESARNILHAARLSQGRGKVWIDEHRDDAGVWYELANKVQPLRPHLYGHNRRAREIAARPAEAGDKSHC